MLRDSGIEADSELLKYILRLNAKFGVYHTLDMLLDVTQLMEKCRNKREEALVKDFIDLWRKRTALTSPCKSE